MENDKIIQTSPPRLYSYTEKRNKNRSRNKTLKSTKKYNLFIKTDIGANNKVKDIKEENGVIKLQNGTIIGKLYKKTNETEWATQNRALNEKSESNYETNLILKRYKLNKGKLNFGFNNEYIDLLTELLYSKKKENSNYSKERLKLYNYRINFDKKNKKDFNDNYIIKDNLRQKMAVSALTSPNKNNNIHFKTFYSINGRNYSKDSSYNLCRISANNNKTISLNNRKNNFKLKSISNFNEQNKINNHLTLLNSLYKRNNDFYFNNNNISNLKYNKLNINKFQIENKSNNNYLKLFNSRDNLRKINNNNNYIEEKININKNKILKDIDENSNKTIKSLNNNNSSDNSNVSKCINNDTTNRNSQRRRTKKKTKIYKNEKDIYFEKEKEEHEFLASGDRDKYEDYLKNKFGFYEDVDDKQTQYIYEIKKRNVKLFNNKDVEMKNDNQRALNYLNKISRIKKEEHSNVQHEYTIHDIFKERYTKAAINKLRINNNSKNIMKKLKIALK